MEALRWLRVHAERAGWQSAEIIRATAQRGQALPRIDFVAEPEQCPSCGAGLRAYKSQRRTVVTLAHGAFEAREISKRCHAGSCPPVRSEALRQRARPGQRYGYDLMVHVGLARYLTGRQRDEIRQELVSKHAIELSVGTVSALCDRFLSLFEALHLKRAPQLRAAQHGGYPLHIDATCEHGKGGLFLCMDGWRGWALTAARIPSENAAYLTPVVARAVELFGRPIATMRDMGDGGAHAVEALRRDGVPDLICHYHFVAAVGRNLFDKLYGQLRAIVRLSHVRTDLRTLLRELRLYAAASPVTEGRYGRGLVREDLKALLVWILDGDGRKDAPYPFALPHLQLARRCRQAVERAEQWVPCPRTQPERRAIEVLTRRMVGLYHDPRLLAAVESLEEHCEIFSELRSVLRLCDAGLACTPTPVAPRQLPALELLRLEKIRQAVECFETELRQRIAPAERGGSRPCSPAAIVATYIERNRAHLFGHPARLGPDGRAIAVVDRTNNVIEHFFGTDKQRLRRRLGRAHLCQDLEQQPAQVALVSNLRHDDYVAALCGSLDNLPAALASLDTELPAAPGPPAREQRDKELQQRVRQLLAMPTAVPEAAAAPLEPARCTEIEGADLASRWPELEPLGNDELRLRCAHVFDPPPPKPRDSRLPPPGTVLERRFRGRVRRLTVLDDGFLYRGRRYPHLTAVAKAITGTSYNGYKLFRLHGPWQGQAEAGSRHRRNTDPPSRATAATGS